MLEDDVRYYIVTEYIRGGELYERIIKMRSFQESDAATIVRQVLLAANYMHRAGIVHR